VPHNKIIPKALIKRNFRAGGVTPMVECLISKHEALSSSLNMRRERERERER
jgi:hypothetical protein